MPGKPANVVAAMGTAVTEQQIGLVKRLSRNIVLALDADAAGQGATVRSLEMLPGALDQELAPIGAERDISRPRAETMIVLPAPVSPVMTFKPPPNSTSISSMTA